MRNPLSKFLKQYFNYSKSDRNAIIVFIILIIIGIVVNEVIKSLPPKSKYDYLKFAQEVERLEGVQKTEKHISQELFSFNPNIISEQELDSLLLPDFVKRNLLSYRNAGGKFFEPSDLSKLYGMNDSIFHAIESYVFIPKEEKKQPSYNSQEETKPEGYFDPNTADRTMLSYFGFNDFQTENLISYREAGGKFQQSSDLLKIYGVDTIFLLKIFEHIQIKESENIETAKENVDNLVVIELNSADSLQLLKLNGIGPTFASRIIKYRDLLGGFYSRSQLLEVYNFPKETFDNIKNEIEVDTTLLKKMRINFMQYNELIRHPYLNNDEVNLILKYRNQNGSFADMSEISSIAGVGDSTIIKIKPYITCR